MAYIARARVDETTKEETIPTPTPESTATPEPTIEPAKNPSTGDQIMNSIFILLASTFTIVGTAAYILKNKKNITEK